MSMSKTNEAQDFKEAVMLLFDAGMSPDEIRKTLNVRPHKVHYILKKTKTQ